MRTEKIRRHLAPGAARRALIPAFLVVAGLPSLARPHDDEHHRLAAKKLVVRSIAAGSGSNKLAFKATKQLAIGDMSLDPRTLPSSLTIRGTGAAEGETGVIGLDPSKWTTIGKAPTIEGYKYKDNVKQPSSKGVKRIVLKAGSNGGSLVIKAGGNYWPTLALQTQTSVEVFLNISDNTYCAAFSDFTKNEPGKVVAKDAPPPAECDAVCGNAILELGEECDDGNLANNDTCTTECLGCSPQDVEFASTFEGIQSIIFDNPAYGCSNDACHGLSVQGGLDLRAGTSYGELVGVPSQIDPQTLRVFAGDQDLSMLYNKIAAKTLTANPPAIPGTSMPSGAGVVSEDHLEALRLWIRGGAPEQGVVAGTADLLGSCLPPANPLKIPQPAAPDPSLGVQLAQPGYDLPAQSETELCVPSYYDVSTIVPAQFQIPCPGAFPGTNEVGPNAGKCFAYDSTFLAQDPQSHHSIIHIYAGDYDQTDPGWGTWTCFGGANDGLGCDPAVNPADCPDGVCGGTPRPGAACLSLNPAFGPPDYGFFNNNAPTFGGAQESTSRTDFPAGVYGLLPLKGVVVWNSHAFNLTSQDMNMEAWMNLTFTNDLQFVAEALFDTTYIFTQNVPAFQKHEYCATHTFAEGTRLFQLNSHTHKRGKHWRYYAPPQTPCPSGGPAPSDPSVGSATSASCVPGPGLPFYESFDYSDALDMTFDPSWHFTGSVADRTIKFCSVYDNGFTDPAEVKRFSMSPLPASPVAPGGPCSNSDRSCLGGPNKAMPCVVDEACPGSVCDACVLKGGVTTEDEMFIPLGTFYVDP